MIRVGVVGAGHMPQRAHIPSLIAERARCTVVALADPKPETARLVAERFGIPAAYTGLRDLLLNEEVDALVMSVPDSAHAETTIAALEAGAHVFMEKPLATTVEDGERMVAAAYAAQRVLHVGFQRRHDPAAERVRALLSDWRTSGELGELRLVRYLSLGGDWICSPDPIIDARDTPVTGIPPYRWPEGLPESLQRKWDRMNNYVSHVLDLLRYLLGPPSSVLSAHLDRPTAWTVSLDWGGVPVELTQGPEQRGRWQEWIEFLFDGGWLRFSTPPALRINTPGRIEVYRAAEGRIEEIEAPFEWAFRRQITHFLRAVAGEVEPNPTPEEALGTLCTVDAIFRRAAESTEGTPIQGPK